jgi:uncharacterized membrane protein
VETLLLIGLIVLAVVVRRQAQRIAAMEDALRRFEPGRSEAAPAVVRHVPPASAPPFVSSEVQTRRPVEPAPAESPSTALGTNGIDEVPQPAGATFEQLVAGRLPIWVGGAALAIAGYFLVRLAIESGLLTPAVRVALASLFGFVLLALAEGAARVRAVAQDARINQALAGAGIATLYAAAYLAGSHYGLIGPIAAFAMMAAVTALALGLSLRRGAPTALMGLVGGFATPLLAGAQGQAVLPLLVYLGLLSAGLLGLAVVRGWLWLTLASAAGSLLWSGLLIATASGADAIAAGGFVLLLAIAATWATAAGGGEGRRLIRTVPLAIAAAELALLIAMTGFGAGAWALYLLLSAATIVLAWRDPRLTPAAAATLLLSTAALAGSAYAAPATTLVGAGVAIALLFGGTGHALARRGADGRWWAAIGAGGLAAPFAILRIVRPDLAGEAGWAALSLILAVPPLHLAWRSRTAARSDPPFDVPLQVGAGTAAAFLATAIALPLPLSLVPAAILAGAAALAEGGRRIGDRGLFRLAFAAAAIAVVAMLMRSGGIIEALAAALAGERVLLPFLPGPADAVGGALLPAGLIAFVAWRADTIGARPRRLLIAAAGLAAALGIYVLWKQLFAIRAVPDFVARGFLERAILTQILFAGGWAARRMGWQVAARAVIAVAAGRLLWLDLVVFNPAFVAQAVGRWPLANLVTLHFAAAASWIALAWRAEPPGRGRLVALAALVVAAVGGVLLTVRQAFHGALTALGPVGRAEFYAYSAAGILLAVALFGWGVRIGDRAMRIAGLGLLTLIVLKVFLIDAAALEGLLRIASFLGLGVTLIGIGWAYGRFRGGHQYPDAPVRA